MKKLISLAFVALVATALIGCGGDKPKPSGSGPMPSQPQPSTTK